MNEVPPLSSELEAMLVHERELEPESPELRLAKRRVWQGVALAVGTAIPLATAAGSAAAASSVGSSAAGSSAAGAGAAGTATAGGTAGAATLGSGVAGGTVAAGVAGSASVAKIALAVGLAAFVAGGLTGGAVTQAWLTPQPAPTTLAPVETDRLAPSNTSPTDSTAIRPQRGVDIDSLPTAEPEDPTPKNSTEAPAPADSLTRERLLLDVARAALGAGNPSEAMSALRRHSSQFPDGQLREERQALLISALRAAGKQDEAESAARGFQEDFPDSLFGPSIQPKKESTP